MRTPESIKAKLKNCAVRTGKPFDYMLTHYFIERMLYRLSISPYGERFILKGGVFLYSLFENDARTTRDIDFLAQSMSNVPEKMADVFREVCSLESDDAIRFDLDSLVTDHIAENAQYIGIRIKITGYLGNTRQVVQLDVGFGDIVVPEYIMIEYPSILDMERPLLHAYSKESVIAEKFEAMISLAEANSRMKDFFDVYMLSKFDYDGSVLYEAIRQTMVHRETVLVQNPIIFSDDFTHAKRVQWNAFQKRIGQAQKPVDFTSVMNTISLFLHPLYAALVAGEKYAKVWTGEAKKWQKP